MSNLHSFFIYPQTHKPTLPLTLIVQLFNHFILSKNLSKKPPVVVDLLEETPDAIMSDDFGRRCFEYFFLFLYYRYKSSN